MNCIQTPFSVRTYPRQGDSWLIHDWLMVLSAPRPAFSNVALWAWWSHLSLVNLEANQIIPWRKDIYLFCYLTLVEKSRVQIFIILRDTSFLLSSPDQMAGVVLLSCISQCFLWGSPSCRYLIFQTGVPSWPAGSPWLCSEQMENLLVSCWATLNVISFYFHFFGISVNFFF